jgi:RNA polymerase-binding transcription factor DksA
MDAVQQYAENYTADALAQHARRPVVQGRTHCANTDCGEPIAPTRTALGAQLCLDCQHAEEARAAHFAKWGHR